MSDLPTELVPLSDEQRAVVELTRAFAREEIRPRARGVDEADVETPWDLWRKAAKAGITGFMLPEEYGGGGFTDVFTQCLVQEEPCAGSDAASIITTAHRTERGYRLNGQKVWISNAGEADRYVVFAKTDPTQRSRGVSAFLLRKDTDGVSFGEPMKKMGQRAIVCREIFFRDAHVPEEHRLGAEGQGFHGLMRTFDVARTVLGAAATGVARTAYEYARDYARERRQFGRPIIEHHAVAFRLADMRMRVQQARLMTWRAARRLDAGLEATAEAAMAKLTASATAAHCTWAAVQTLGGWGCSREFPVEQWMRDAKLEEIEEGTSDIMRLVIARSL